MADQVVVGSVIGTVTQQDTPSTHLQRSVSSILSKLLPDLVPLDTLTNLSKEGEKPINNKIEWESYSMYPRRDVVIEDAAAGAPGASVNWKVQNPGYFRVNMVIRIPSDTTAPLLLVEAVDSTSGFITVRALGEGAFGTVPQISAGTQIAWLGTSVAHGGTVTDPQALMPANEYNYTQTLDTSVAIDIQRMWQKNYGSIQDWPRVKNDMRFEYRLSREFIKWFGIRSKTTDSATNKLRTTMNGVTQYITTELQYDKDAIVPVPESLMLDWLTEVFGGNNGSPSRYFFADKYLINAMSKTDLVNPRYRKPVTIYGVTFNEITTNFGTLYIKYTPAFNIFGYDNYGVILDMNHIRNHVAIDMRVEQRDYKSQGILKEGEYYFEESSLSVRFGSQYHAIVRGV